LEARLQSIAPRDSARASGDDGALEDAGATAPAGELREALAEVDRLQRALERSAVERRELLEVACHELRTPITVIRGYARLLLDDAVGTLAPDQRGFVEEMARSCTRLDDFVELLVRASREERLAAETIDRLDPKEAPLAPVLEGAVAYVRPLLEERGVRVELALDPAADRARFDAARIEQVVTNLLANGIEHAGPGARLRIHTRPVENGGDGGAGWVEVGVSDDGPGIPESERVRIFAPHVRGSGAREGRGSGLGLAICRRIVEAHGGWIEARPAAADETDRNGGTDRSDRTDAGRAGGGCCVAFVIPAVEPAAAPQARG
jgi:two-component system sensor histidine kinase BaeS